MARPASFNKRDIEKKKLSKRLEKQKKKDEKKTSGKGKGFDDMIAYVDENGMITDTPPDLEKKENIETEDILISVPKKEDLPEETMNRGRVEHLNQAKGYGFIKDIAGTDKYFFHVSECIDEVAEGNIVLFELRKGKKGMNAVEVKLEK